MEGSIFSSTGNKRGTQWSAGGSGAVIGTEGGVIHGESGTHSFVLERFPVEGRVKISVLPLSRLIQPFLVHEPF